MSNKNDNAATVVEAFAKRHEYLSPSDFGIADDNIADCVYGYVEFSRPIDNALRHLANVNGTVSRDDVISAIGKAIDAFDDLSKYNTTTDSHGTMSRQRMRLADGLLLCAEVMDYDRIWVGEATGDGTYTSYVDAYSASLYLSYDLCRFDIARAIAPNDDEHTAQDAVDFAYRAVVSELERRVA